MSESSSTVEPKTVERDGISVSKRLLLDAFPVPTIEFELASSRDDTAEVVIREYVPDGYSLEAIGFHNEYESENWEAYQDNRIEFTRTIDSGETVTTIYGLRLEDADAAHEFMGSFDLVTVDPVSTSERSRPGLTIDTQTDEEVTQVETAVDLDDLPAGAIAEALADEFREGTVDEADREAIQEALDLDLSNSAEAQFRQLQSRVEDLLAYTDMIESFIDDGGPKERFEELDDRMDDLSETMDVLREETLTDDDLEAIQTQLDALEETVEDIESWRGELGEMFVEKEE